MQLILPLLSLCVLFFLLDTAPESLERKPERLELSVIFREDDSVWATAREGMEQAAADLRMDLRFLAPASDNDVGEQRELIRRELEAGADGLILYPADCGILETIPGAEDDVVVTLEADLTGNGADAYIGVDNRAYGESLGFAVLNGVPMGGTALLLDSVPGENGVRERMDAVSRVLTEHGRQVKIFKTEDGRAVSDLMAQINDVDALVTFESSALETASEVIASLYRIGESRTGTPIPLLYGMGATPAIAAGLEQSRITALVAQNDFSAGYLAVVTAARLIRDGRAPEQEQLPYELVRRENMYDEDRQKLLFPVTR